MKMKEAYVARKLFETLDELSTLIFEIYGDQIIELWDEQEEEQYYSESDEKDLSNQIDLPDPFWDDDPQQT